MKTLVGVAPAATFFRNLANHQHGSQLLIDVDGPMFVFSLHYTRNIRGSASKIIHTN